MQRRDMIIFLCALWGFLALVWMFSGEQFLDLMFAMPDAGGIDDIILTVVIWFEDLRVELSPPDVFDTVRALLHKATGLG